LPDNAAKFDAFLPFRQDPGGPRMAPFFLKEAGLLFAGQRTAAAAIEQFSGENCQQNRRAFRKLYWRAKSIKCLDLLASAKREKA
jgi:hypothetical protein